METVQDNTGDDTTQPAADTALVLWPNNDGTAGLIDAGSIRALIGYIEQRDAEDGAK